MSKFLSLPLVAVVLLATACTDSSEPATPAATPNASAAAPSPGTAAPGTAAPGTAAPGTAAPAAAPTGAPADSSGLAPMTSRTPSPSGSVIEAPGAVFDLPAGWQAEAPSSSMRLAQATIPGDAGAGQLTVFYFGPGGGGPVDANLDRWLGQVEVDAGSTPTRDTFTKGEFRGTWVEVIGTIKPSTMGVGPTTPQPDSRLIAAVVEGPQGPWFFKSTGPASTLEAQRPAFLAMLQSVRTP